MWDRMLEAVLTLTKDDVENGGKTRETLIGKDIMLLQGKQHVKVPWLLKNKENILPLKPGTHVALIGDFAFEPRYQGAGSSHGECKQSWIG